MTDIIIQGIYGRMGRALVEKIGAREDCRIVAGVDREAGRIGEIPVYAGFDALPCKGVIIDFSSPAGAVAAAQYGAANGLPCVICSTGLSREDEAALEAASTRTPIFRSANMSVGVNVLIELARQATKILGGEFDIEIIEKHHHNKLDAPSGTALMIADAINTEANGKYEYVYDRTQVRPKRGAQELAEPEPTATPEPTPEPTPTVETVHFSATGDDLIHDGIFLQAKERGGDHYDFDAAYAAMQGYYDQFDVNWLNQETLVNDEFAASGYPMFSTPGEITDTLYNLGFRVFSLSNNHSYDKGAAGIEASMAHWAAMPDDVVTMGFYNLETYDNYAYQTVNGITFGYLSYTEHTNGLPTPSGTDYGVVYLDDHETIAKQIADMRPNCDVLIVSAHMGTEGTHEVNDFQRETAQWLADQGVDVIIGTHPHVIQNAAWLTGANGNTTFIVYSLGNFINAQSSRDNVIGAILDVYFDKTTQPDGSVSIAIRDPKLHCVISQYEAGYKNIRVIPYSQYTDELGAAHGEFTLSREYIESMLRSTIDEEFLTLD